MELTLMELQNPSKMFPTILFTLIPHLIEAMLSV